MKKLMIMFCFVILSFLINSSVQAQKSKSFKETTKTRKSSLKYQYINAFSDGRGVYLQWQTEYETNNFGFYIYRVSGSEKVSVNSSIVGGAYLQTGEEKAIGKTYSFYDDGGDSDSVYVIESVDTNSFRRVSDEVLPQPLENLPDALKSDSVFGAKIRNNSQQKIEKSDLNLPKDLQAEVAGYETVADEFAHRLAVGQEGVKIGVKKDGLYRVSRAELQAAGFDVSVSPALWQLFANGSEQSIIVGENGDYIEFYGRGIDTPESDTRFYYLVAGQGSGKRMKSTTLRSFAGTVLTRSYNQSFVFKERTVYHNSILNGGNENFFGRAITNSGATINFNLSAVDFNAAEAIFKLSLQGGTQTGHQIKVVLNDQELNQIVGSGFQTLSKEYRIQPQLLREGTNTLKLTGVMGISLLESIRVSFNRGYAAQQNELAFYTQNYKAANLTGFSSANIRVFDMTDSQNPVIINGLRPQQSAGGFGVTLPAHRGRVMYAVENSAVLTPASITTNTPSSLATAAHNAELVIISHKNFLTEAEIWASYRRSQGITVEVVDVEDIYDEFNSGVLSSMSIRSFLQYAKNNWQTPPKYALLIGDSSYDSRNYKGLGNFNYVPTKLIDTVYEETGSDDALADFNDDGLAEIAIGRIPARTGQVVIDALAKVKTFESNISTAQSRGALFASDLPDGYDFEALSRRLAAKLPESMPKTFVNRGSGNAQTLLLNEMNSGKFLINYSGHGNIGVWAHSSYFSKTSVAQLTNANNLSVYSMLSCLNGYFISPDEDSLSELLLKSNSGGAVAAWSSTGKTTPDIQEIMATRFYSQIAAGNITRLGDLINDAKTTINAGRDVRLSWALLGDPMLKMK